MSPDRMASPSSARLLSRNRPDEPQRPPYAIRGRLINAANHQPLVGVRVIATFGRRAAAGAAPWPEESLGEAVTDSRGGFAIVASDTVGQQIALLDTLPGGAELSLRVESDGGLLHEATFSRERPLPVPLAIPVAGGKLGADAWAEVARRMREVGIHGVHELALHLILLPPPSSAFGDWDLATRHGLLDALEAAFLDPAGLLSRQSPPPSLLALRDPVAREAWAARLGDAADRDADLHAGLTEVLAKAEAFADLLEIDWPLDTETLGEKGPGAAILAYQKSTLSGVTPGPIGGGATPLLRRPNDLTRYRDYLRNLYTGALQDADFASRHQALRDRFHQDFKTLDTTSRPANEVLIPIVREILIAETGSKYGFGLAPAAIEPRGDRPAREFLDLLLELSGLTPRQFGLRYRLDCERPDSAISSRVGENTFTLHRFYADGFQSAADPHPIVPGQLQGRAPFFLQYEEWLQGQGVFHAENHLPLRQTFFINATAKWREAVRGHAAANGPGDDDVVWLAGLLDLEDKLAAAHAAFDQGELGIAQSGYQEAAQMATAALVDYPGGQVWEVADALAAALAAYRQLPVTSQDELAAFVEHLQIPYVEPLANGPQSNWWEFKDWLAANMERLELAVVHLCVLAIPCWQGDVSLAMGEFARALSFYGRTTRFLVARADAGDRAGSPELDVLAEPKQFVTRYFYWEGALPYTADVSPQARQHYPFDFYHADYSERLAGQVVATHTHPVERRFLRLRHGQAILEWADALYRLDDAASIARARELYKAALFLHGASPGVSPAWPTRGLPTQGAFALDLGAVGAQLLAENPAVASQKARARLALAQIDAGLNYYGTADDLVPALRYRPLKEAADRLAVAAKAAQQDILAYAAQLEEALREGIATANVLKKALLQRRIADEQRAIAEYNVRLGEKQVEQVEAALEETQKRIEEEDEFFNQLGDFFVGMGKAISGLAGGLGAAAGAGGAATGEAAAVGAGFSYSSSAGMAAAGGGLVLGGYAIFIYAAYTSMASMIEERSNLRHQRTALRDDILPAAKEQVRALERGVAIAGLQRQVAEADAELAMALIKFQSERFLNNELWASLLAVMRRVLRRYLELGARYAWLAERALAYEQDRAFDIVRFDYFPQRLQNLTGADLLLADLAEIEAARLDGLRRSLPIKHTVSLAFDHPVTFVQLQQTGRCLFQTRELPLRRAYPGTYGHRVRAVTVTVKSVDGSAAPRGLLLNPGGSLVSRVDGSTRVLPRGADALPISEFQLRDDLAVYGLPGETLMSFEGSGIETLWELELATAANPGGLAAVADVLLTFDLQAQFSPELRAKELADPELELNRMVLVSARLHAPAALVALRDPEVPTVTIAFDLPTVGLPAGESDRRVSNLVLLLAAAEPLAAAMTLAAAAPPVDVAFSVVDGVALSDAPPLVENGSSPLNAFAAQPVDQLFQLTIDKGVQPAVDFSTVADVVLGIEYRAQLVG